MPEQLPDLAGLLAGAASECPDRVALVAEDGRTLTWRDLDDEASRVATGLGEAGVVAGQRVMLVLGNRAELVSAYLGVLRAQAVAVPVNPTSTAHELGLLLEHSGSVLVVAEPATLTAVREAAGDTARQGPANTSGVSTLPAAMSTSASTGVRPSAVAFTVYFDFAPSSAVKLMAAGLATYAVRTGDSVGSRYS